MTVWVSCLPLAGCGALTRHQQRAPLLRATGGLNPMVDVQPRTPVAVPMVRDPNHTVPIVRARINRGELFPLVLDTGGNHTMIGRQRATVSDVEIMGMHGQITTAFGNQQNTQLGIVGELGIGQLAIRGMPVLVHEFGKSSLSPSLGGELNVMGTPALAAFSYITFDYSRQQVIFDYAGHFVPPARDRSLRLPLKVTHEGHLSVPVTFPNGRTRQVIVDTGYDGVLLVSEKSLQELDLAGYSTKGRPVRAVGPGAEIDGQVFFIPGLVMDGRPIPNVETWTGPLQEPLLLGSGLLRYFRTTFDFRSMTLWMELE
ncbi:MAG: aspartyl protease family protein [Verrucomicrobiales bacterium]